MRRSCMHLYNFSKPSSSLLTAVGTTDTSNYLSFAELVFNSLGVIERDWILKKEKPFFLCFFSSDVGISQTGDGIETSEFLFIGSPAVGGVKMRSNLVKPARDCTSGSFWNS
ncbi:hypothetical protein HAX54_028852 [Datura stramonium]|uniref:Uncharacterized protein n=1 Tax=Datura stramonium TaxID=4076 RepID=A0ABS8V621_DATST|nr:hypothetical protein [Datura stramonium]